MSKNDTGEVRKFAGITIRHRLSWEAFGMKKFLLSGLICLVVVIVARTISDTFAVGMFAGIIYAALDLLLVERMA